MEMMTFSAKTVEDAVTKALIDLETTSDKLEYEVVEKGSAGFLGIGAKPAVIRARKKESVQDRAVNFLSQVFDAMNIQVEIASAFNEEEKEISITLEGEDMGILIGKRGQTLDSLQYLVSLIVNKDSEDIGTSGKRRWTPWQKHCLQGKEKQTSGFLRAYESL